MIFSSLLPGLILLSVSANVALPWSVGTVVAAPSFPVFNEPVITTLPTNTFSQDCDDTTTFATIPSTSLAQQQPPTTSPSTPPLSFSADDSSSSPSHQPRPKPKLALIAGAVVGAVVLSLVLILAFLILRRNRRERMHAQIFGSAATSGWYPFTSDPLPKSSSGSTVTRLIPSPPRRRSMGDYVRTSSTPASVRSTTHLLVTPTGSSRKGWVSPLSVGRMTHGQGDSVFTGTSPTVRSLGMTVRDHKEMHNPSHGNDKLTSPPGSSRLILPPSDTAPARPTHAVQHDDQIIIQFDVLPENDNLKTNAGKSDSLPPRTVFHFGIDAHPRRSVDDGVENEVPPIYALA